MNNTLTLKSEQITRIIDLAKTAFGNETKGQLSDYWNAIETADGQHIDINIWLKSDEDDKDEVHAVTAYEVADDLTVTNNFVQVATFINGELAHYIV
jgi:hypothetical protein